MADTSPLDIDYKKVPGMLSNIMVNIIEWLLERKKLPKEWTKKHKAIILKLEETFRNNSIQDSSTSSFLKENQNSNSTVDVFTLVRCELSYFSKGIGKNTFN